MNFSITPSRACGSESVSELGAEVSTAKGATPVTYGRSVRLLIFGDRDLSRSMSPRINIFVTAAWVPSSEAYVITAVRADGADAKELPYRAWHERPP